MEVYTLNAHGVRSLFKTLKDVLPKEQSDEMHHALYYSGLAKWTRSAWLTSVAEKLETAVAENGSANHAIVEIRWYNPKHGNALISAEPEWFDVEEIEED
jgi:hypothetical protein